MAEKESAPSVHWVALLAVILVAAFVAALAFGSGGSGSQVNIEYFYRLLYNCIRGACYGSANGSVTGIVAFLAHLWIWVTIIGYLLAVAALVVIVYSLIRLFELRHEEEHEYGKLLLAPSSAQENQRWIHIKELAGGASPSDWRQAIIEADIMLDDMLTKQGYSGAGVAEKLKQVEPSDFDTLDDAWEAHKVRNQIAHQGSAFDLSETLARRTLARYEAVFREFEAL